MKSREFLPEQSSSLSGVNILIAGDLAPHHRLQSMDEKAVSQLLSPELKTLIQSHDLSMVNLECPLTNLSPTPIAKVGPHLKADPFWAACIRSYGFHLVTLANNHIMDMGEPGLRATLDACQKANLSTVGAGFNLSEAVQPYKNEINGIKIAVLNVVEAEFSLATAQGAGAWPIDEINNYYQIREAKEWADFILIILHGGNEYFELPNPDLVKTCRFFVDIGADAVVCHHTHTPSVYEVYKSRPIFYGIGNFMFDWPTDRDQSWYLGYMVSLQVSKHREIGWNTIPYSQCKKDPGVTLLRPNEAEEFQLSLAKKSEILRNIDNLEKAWEIFSSKKHRQYLSALLGANRIERFLWQKGVLKTSFQKERLRILQNLIRCQAHRLLLLEVLNKELME